MLKKPRDKMVSFGNTETAEELCALLLGQKRGNNWICTRFVPLENVAHSPVYYDFNPQEFMDIMCDTRFFDPKAPIDFLGIYHTHPNHIAYPSVTDINEAGYKGVYIIHSPKFNQTNTFFCAKPGDKWSALDVKL